jgi:hypothetical protein
MVVITHHITTYAILCLLIAWTVMGLIRRRHGHPGVYVPLVPTLSLALGAGLWVALVAPLTVGYLLPVAERALSQGLDLVLHQQPSRVLFANPGGAVQPHWEQWAAFGAAGLVVIFVPVGLVAFHHRWPHPLTSVLAWTSLLYIVLLPLRLTYYGQEAANRSGEFLFVGLALIISLVLIAPPGFVRAHARNRRLVTLLGSWRRLRGGTAAVAFVVCSVMFIGGIAISWSFADRLPPPVNASVVPLTPTQDVIEAALWMRSEFGPDHRVATDITTGLAFDTFGDQDVLSGESDGSHVWRIFEPVRMTRVVYRELVASRVNFIVVQKQLTYGLPPVAGVPVYDSGEPLAADHQPVSRASQAKFVTAPGLSMVYTSGTITIYQVNLSRARTLETAA